MTLNLIGAIEMMPWNWFKSIYLTSYSWPLFGSLQWLKFFCLQKIWYNWVERPTDPSTKWIIALPGYTRERHPATPSPRNGHRGGDKADGRGRPSINGNVTLTLSQHQIGDWRSIILSAKRPKFGTKGASLQKFKQKLPFYSKLSRS